MGINDITVTRFPNGITNRPENDIFGGALRMPDPTRYHVFFDDFDYFPLTDDTPDVPLAGYWTLDMTDANAYGVANGDGGIFLADLDADAGDHISMIKTGLSFLVEQGKKLFFKTRFSLETIEGDEILRIGLADDATIAPSDCVQFRIDAGDGNIDFVVVDNTAAVTSATNIASMADGEEIELAFMFDGVDRFYYAVNNVVLGYLTVAAADLPAVLLAPAMYLENDSAGTDVEFAWDFVFTAKERG